MCVCTPTIKTPWCGKPGCLAVDTQRSIRMRYSPVTGMQYTMGCDAALYRQENPKAHWWYNPWTSKKRDPRDVESDPFGLLIAAPSEPLVAVPSPLAVQVAGDHYKKLKIQPVEYNHANGIGFAEGSVIKYVTRWREKGGIKDLEKAKHFIELLIELEGTARQETVEVQP